MDVFLDASAKLLRLPYIMPTAPTEQSMTKRLSAIAATIVFAIGISRAAPAPPSNLSAQVSGNTVNLTWSAPVESTLTGFRLQAGTAPGLSNVADVILGVTTQLTATSVPSGTYYVRVRALDATGESAPSNEIAVSVGGGGCAPPAAPIGLAATVVGNVVTVTWQAVSGAGVVYLLEAGSALGLSNVGVFNVGPVLSLTASAPNGTYYVRVRGANACGSGAASSDIAVTVGGSAPPPQADWLTQVNLWRARAGVPAVGENPVWSQGDFLHSRYSVKNDVLQHDEAPSNPWYTLDGRAAAMASNGSGNNRASAPDSYAIESWVQAPFHGIGMFDPKRHPRTCIGIDPTAAAARISGKRCGHTDSESRTVPGRHRLLLGRNAEPADELSRLHDSGGTSAHSAVWRRDEPHGHELVAQRPRIRGGPLRDYGKHVCASRSGRAAVRQKHPERARRSGHRAAAAAPRRRHIRRLCFRKRSDVRVDVHHLGERRA